MSADLPEGTWVEACDVCNAKGIKNGALCPKCEGRCYLEHSHEADAKS